MAATTGASGQCSNFGNCSLADGRKTTEVPRGMDFVCPECGKPLLAQAGGGDSGRSKTPLIIGAVLLLAFIVVGYAAWSLLAGRGKVPPAVATASAPSTAKPAAIPVAAATVVLRIAGSNTLGSKLVPMLAEGWLKSEGATSVQRVAGASPLEVSVQGRFADGSAKAVDIAAHGSSTAFEGLARGTADVGMSSRRITPAEVTRLANLGDLTSLSSEHVLGLDGLAVIVHKSNPITALSKPQLAALFAGDIADWAQLAAAAKGKTGAVTLYARDEKSGTFDSFQQLVLGAGKLSDRAKRFEDSAQLSDAVAADPNGIGFIGLPYVRSARALGVSDKAAAALLPNRFTVATEDYVLSRRLYLYTATAPTNANAARFVEFAKAKAGQDVVAQQGFIEQTVQAQDKAAGAADVVPVGDVPAEYRQATANATRLSLNFRFRTGSKELDNKAVPDLDRVVSFLSDVRTPPGSVMLFGFADSRGGADANLKLSRERARTVADEFKQRGVPPGVVSGFGAALPVASNDSPEGQERNRRVEIWIRR